MTETDQEAKEREQRSTSMLLSIDPGFFHLEKVQTLIGEDGKRIVDELIAQFSSAPEYLKETYSRQFYAHQAMAFCNQNKIQSFHAAVLEHDTEYMCGPVQVAPYREELGGRRLISEVLIENTELPPILLKYSENRIVSDTIRSKLSRGSVVNVFAKIEDRSSAEITVTPILIGDPSLVPSTDLTFDPVYLSHTHYELQPSDIDQFSEIRNMELPKSHEKMGEITEYAFKSAIMKILGGEPEKDWGGEQCDIFHPHTTVNNISRPSAFLLKGPGNGYREMKLNHLGKNNDQIYRLSKVPAKLLIVQHCHDIGPEVRDTLRAFSATPGYSRFYCCIDGRDSLRILEAYDLLDQAIEESAKEREKRKEKKSG